MKYPFPHIEDHKSYKSTFLVEVEWRLHYCLSLNSETYIPFNKFIADVFRYDISEAEFRAMGIKPMRFTSQDEYTRVKFTDDFAEFKFSGFEYQSYAETVLPILKSFITAISECDCKLNSISCTKKNLISFNSSNQTSDEEEIFKDILSQPLLSATRMVVKAQSDSQKLEDSMYLVDFSENADSFQILYGYYDGLNRIKDNTTKENENINCVIVESKSKAKLESNNPDEVLAKATDINTYLYDFMRWAFADVIYKSMDKDTEK